jgi:hypothetical protein
LIFLAALPGMALAQGFKFSNEDKAQQEAAAARQQKIDAQLSTPCLERIKNRKIMVLIGEEVNGAVQAKQAAFSPHFDAINARLQKLGLRTYTRKKSAGRSRRPRSTPISRTTRTLHYRRRNAFPRATPCGV